MSSSDPRALAKQLISGNQVKRSIETKRKPITRIKPIGRSFDDHPGIIELLNINQQLDDKKIDNP
ncbi:MAG: hypothetical protein KAG86_11085, partial [Gammaproteobacteria bacterium]|nr:hypothetical protein [Gammaproteobacteria bacterium]